MRIEETADKTIRGPWCFELDVDQSIRDDGLRIGPAYYSGNVHVAIGKGIGVLISPEEAETIANILRDFAARARSRAPSIRSPEGDR
jgi:hypothetical protein